MHPENTSILTWLDRLARWSLAGVFLYAGLPKLLSPVSFASIIEAYGLIPEFMLLFAAITISLLEVIAAIQLVRGKRSGLWLSVGLMALFIFVLTYGIRIGLDVDCGCFAPGDIEHQAFSNLRSALIRDLVLSIPLVYSLIYSYELIPTQIGGKK